MARDLKDFKIFIASPGGLENEREAFKKLFADFNTYESNPRGVNFTPVGWEITLGGIGRPQKLINNEIEECDYMVLVLHDRWGTKPNNEDMNSQYSSGTEEEFYKAIECINDKTKPMIDIIVFFKAVTDRQLSDPGAQLSKVLSFRKRLEDEKNIFFGNFDSTEKFCNLVRNHLSTWTRTHEKPVQLARKKIRIESSDSIYNENDYDVIDKLSLQENIDIAEKYFQIGKSLEAEITFAKILAKYSVDGLIYCRYGRFLRKIGQHDRAIDMLQKAISISHMQTDKSNEAYANRQIGRVYEIQGKINISLEYFNKAHEIYSDLNYESGVARSLRDIGLASKKLHNYDYAITCLKKSLSIYEKLNDQESLASTFGYLGLIFKTKGEWANAEESHNKALAIHKTLNNEEGTAFVLSNLGVVQRMKGQFMESIENHNLALKYFKKTNNKKGVLREYSNLGVSYRNLNQLDKSMEMHEISLQLSEELGIKDGIMMQYGNLGIVSKMMSKYDQAEAYYKNALDIALIINDQASIALQYRNIAILYKLQNEIMKSIALFEKSMEIEVKINNQFNISKLKLEYGHALCLNNNTIKGLELLHSAKLFFVSQRLENELSTANQYIKQFEE